MRDALHEANAALFLCAPNPRVGCVITDSSGQIVGKGHTQKAGGPHAEIMALSDALCNGKTITGSTVYVTLEPCSHHGLTPPCCDALIDAGVKKVVASLADPNPLVAGQGFERLRAAGIQVEVGPGAAESRELNIGFFSRMARQTPWVRLKIAASLDGTTALSNRQSQWITSLPARADGHAWRARSCAVLTGIGTLLQDNPQLNVRLVNTTRQPYRIIVDSLLQTPLDAQVFQAGGQVWIYTATRDTDKEVALMAAGATVHYLPNAQGKVDLTAMMHDLSHRQINELHVEAGSKLNASLLRAGLADELLVYIAPKLLGPGYGMASLESLQTLSDSIALQFQSAEMVGDDLRVIARLAGRSQF